MRALILAAGVGRRLANEANVPKCLLEVGGRTLLERHLDALDAENIQATIVVGYSKERIERVAGMRATFVENDAFERGSILSFAKGIDALGASDDILTMDADVLYHREVLSRLIHASRANAALIDTSASESGEEMMLGVREGRVCRLARRIASDGPFESMGESVGFYRFERGSLRLLRECVASTIASRGELVEYEDALDRFFSLAHVEPIGVTDLPWTEIDFQSDVLRARQEILPKIEAR